MIDKKNISEYLRTFFITLLAVFAFTVIFTAIIGNQVYKDEITQRADEDTIDYYLINVLIDKNKYLEEKNPENYKINLKLGVLYEMQENFIEAENQYKIAISKAPVDEFKPYYRLALLYLKQNDGEKTQKLIDGIDERPIKKLIEYKGDIYTKIGDLYYNKGDYETASYKYQKALYYYKVIKSKKIKDAQSALVSAYVYLAEEKVNKYENDDAIELLYSALAIIDAPIIKYKLAILLLEIDPNKASIYLEEVFKKEPSIINYEAYYKFLEDLSIQANARGEFALANLYKYRQKRIEEFYQGNILSIKDVKIETTKAKIKMDFWRKKYNILLNLKLKNNSGYAIKYLKLQVIFKDSDEIIDTYVNEIANDKFMIKKDSLSPMISIKTVKIKDSNDVPPKEITASVYVSKTNDEYKIHLGDITIKEKEKEKPNTQRKKFRLFSLEFYLPAFV